MLKKILIYFHARLILLFNYKKKYFITGRWFKNKIKGSDECLGWRFVVYAHKALKMVKFNKSVPWPIDPTSRVLNPSNIVFHPDNIDNFLSPGCYFQAIGKIVIGHGTYIAPNVGIITSNHDLTDLDKHSVVKDVIIGENCWIGMNAVVLPGVILGDRTIVGAGSVVTKSFPGNCVIGGNPAKILKLINENNE